MYEIAGRKINQTTQQPSAPLHDDNSNPADASRYMAVIADKMSNETKVYQDPHAGVRHGYAG